MKMIFKLDPQNIFQKTHLDFGGLETNRRREIKAWFFLHMPLYIWI